MNVPALTSRARPVPPLGIGGHDDAPTTRREQDARPTALKVQAVTRSFSGRRVLGPIDLELDSGAVCQLVGPNGAGKTTLLRVAAGLLAPTDGTVTTSGLALYLKPGSGSRDRQTVTQAVEWVIRMTEHRIDADSVRARISQALEVMGITELAASPVGRLSSGQRARVSVMLALAARPRLACLDEPTVHLDQDGVARTRLAVELMSGAGTAVLAATHDPSQLSAVVDGLARLHAGVVTDHETRSR